MGRPWESHPEPHFADYRSTRIRTPKQPPIAVPLGEAMRIAPRWPAIAQGDADLTANGRVNGEPIGERIVVEGKITDEGGRPVKGALVEIWQANSAGRYVHREEVHPAPLDPNFLGAGRFLTGEDGSYRFVTVKPGSYPWGNHRNAWRPAHIHFAVFGAGIVQRLVTQMYFPGDPTLPYDPIFNSTADARVRNRLIASFSMENTVPGWAHAYRFDIVLAGRSATPFEDGHE